MDVLLDVVSDERNPVLYPDSNDYTIKINRPLYNVTNIKLVGAQIPLTQTLINGGNNTFSMNNGTVITLPNRNYSDGAELASNIQEILTSTAASNVETVTFNSNTNTLTFSNTNSDTFSFDFYDGTNGANVVSASGTPASVLGFNHLDTQLTDTLVSSVIDLHGPTSIVLRLTTNQTDINRDVHNTGIDQNLDYTESIYFGRLLTEKYDVNSNFLIFNEDYPVEQKFYKGPEKSIRYLRVRFYYTIGTKLVPYDFGNRNHTLKFQITCNLDKLSTQIGHKVFTKQLPSPVELPTIDLPKRKTSHDKKQLVTGLFICLMCGLLFLILFKQ